MKTVKQAAGDQLTADERYHLDWAKSALFALEHCRPHHADAICERWLEISETDGPRHDPFGFVYGNARLWATAAPPHEITAYAVAALERLTDAHLTVTARKRVLAALWRSLNRADRRAFLARVDADGAFRARRTAA